MAIGEWLTGCLHVAVTLGFLSWMWFKVFRVRKLESSTPSELTTIGILGTFTGIFLGLCPFLLPGNNDISSSIQSLIGGIAVAAVCSIGGMTLALWSKAEQRRARLTSEAKSAQHSGATADTLAYLLQELLDQSRMQNVNLSALQKSIAGDDESTLMTQLQKIRTSFSDKQDHLIHSFDKFAENMAKSNADALIDALREVIKDFNTKISEQFGDNFKHLNEAVGQLLQWQENYRHEIAELQRQYQLCVQGMTASEKSLAGITDKSQAMVEAAVKLQHLLLAYDGYRASLHEHLEAFASISKEAQLAFPIIRDNIETLTGDFTKAVRTATGEVEQTVTQTSKAVRTMTDGLEQTMTDTSKRLKEQVEILDAALQNELTESLKTMGSQLASLSQKFVSDYEPLTTQLEKLVRSASYSGSNN